MNIKIKNIVDVNKEFSSFLYDRFGSREYTNWWYREMGLRFYNLFKEINFNLNKLK